VANSSSRVACGERVPEPRDHAGLRGWSMPSISVARKEAQPAVAPGAGELPQRLGRGAKDVRPPAAARLGQPRGRRVPLPGHGPPREPARAAAADQDQAARVKICSHEHDPQPRRLDEAHHMTRRPSVATSVVPSRAFWAIFGSDGGTTECANRENPANLMKWAGVAPRGNARIRATALPGGLARRLSPRSWKRGNFRMWPQGDFRAIIPA